MAPKNSGPVEDFPDGQGQMAELRDPGTSSRAAPRQSSEVPPRVEIVEQPAEESRFRYSRESRTNGSLLGVNSVDGHKTHPSIRINHAGAVKIRVSGVSKDSPYRPHPHKIVGRENCINGVYTRQEHIRRPNQIIQLKNIGIQCTKREDFAASLQERALAGVNPFGTGYDIKYSSTLLHYLRLAIEVFIPDSFGQWTLYGVVVSDVITDLPTKLRIFHLSHKHGSLYGGTQLTLLTSKLPNQERLVVRFQQPSAHWRVDVRPRKVHHQFGLVVDTPPYRSDGNTSTAVPVTIHLVRPPSGDPDVDKHAEGEPCDFLYIPGPDYEPVSQAPKRQRTDQKTLHPSLLLQDDPVFVDTPPEPQPRTSNNPNMFSELDQWFAERIPLQASQLQYKQNSNQTQRELNPFNRSRSTGSQTENNQDKTKVTKSQNSPQPSTNQVANSTLLHTHQNFQMTYENHQNKSDVFQHQNIPNANIGEDHRETSLKRNYSQMVGHELHQNLDILGPGQMGILNTTFPQQLQRPNSHVPITTPSLAQPYISEVFPQNQMFFEIPPDLPGNSRTYFSSPIASIVSTGLQRNSHPILTPQMAPIVPAGNSRTITASVLHSIPEPPLVDLTGQSAGNWLYQLNSEDMRFFEEVPERRSSSLEDILVSSLEECSSQPPAISEGEALAVDSNISQLNLSPEDIEILSLSNDLEMLSCIVSDDNGPNV